MEIERRDALKSALAFGFGTLMLGLERQARAQTAEKLPPASGRLEEAVIGYLAAWNEREPKRRLELVAKTWVNEGTYIDHARQGRGHDDISAMIAKAQLPFPGYRTALASSIECHHQYVRFSWVAGGAPDTPLYLKGTDIVILADDGRFQAVIGFVDAAPTNITAPKAAPS